MPFRAATTLRCDLPQRGPLQIRVYDAAGRLVRDLLSSGATGPGSLRLVWDGRDNRGQAVASGVYYCRMVAGQHDLRRVLVRIR